jgi:sigma-54 specific flagellar transcriptional regulator A
MVARGEFREDLYYRLRGIVLEVPALRQRVRDLPAIAEAILSRIAVERGVAVPRLSPRATQALGRHPWPGNIRELENALRAAALFAEGDVIELEDFTSNIEGLRDLDIPAPPPSFGFGPPSAPRSVPRSVAPPDFGSVPASEVPVTVRASTNEPKDSASPTEVAYAHVRAGVSLHDLKRQIERDCIEKALAETSGNITRAATLLGMKRPRLSQLVKQYGFGGVAADAADDCDSEES